MLSLLQVLLLVPWLGTNRWGGQVSTFWLLTFNCICSDGKDVSKTEKENYPENKLEIADDGRDSTKNEEFKILVVDANKKEDEDGKSSKDKIVRSGANNTDKKKDDDITKCVDDEEEMVNNELSLSFLFLD